MKKVLALVLLGVLGSALVGCWGPVVRPAAGFSVCPVGWNGLLEYQFSSTSTTVPNHYLSFYEWDFGDGVVVQDYSGYVSHRFDEAGSYRVTLTVTDDRGVKGTVAQDLEVVEVVAVGSYQLSTGFPARVVGDIQSLWSGILHSVVVRARFYDAAGVRLSEGMAEISEVDPGERVRFVVEAKEAAAQIASAKISILSFSADCADGPYPPRPVDEGYR